MKTTRTIGLAVAGILLALSAPAAAEPTDTSIDEDIELGVTLREAGRDQEALERFEAAYRRSKEPRALAQIALAEQALGRWVAAEQHLTEALASSDPWIQARSRPLRRALAKIKSMLASLTVVIPGVDGATVVVNGQRRGTTPLPAAISVVAGRVVIEVSAEGYLPLTHRIELEPQTHARKRLPLVAQPTPKASVASPPPVASPTRSHHHYRSHHHHRSRRTPNRRRPWPSRPAPTCCCPPI